MGIIRGGALAIISALLFLSIFLGALLLTISWSLNYENVQPKLQTVVAETLDNELGLESSLADKLPIMQASCTGSSDYIVKYEGNDIIIPCNVVAQGQDAVIAHGVNQFIEKIYFTPYDCNLWSCFGKYQIPFFLVSAKSQSYFYSLFNYALIAIGILSILGFLLAEKKSNFFLLIAVLIGVASLPFAKFDLFIGIFGVTVKGLLSVFFSKAYSVFFGMIILAGALFLLGWLLKLFRIGFKLSTIFQKKEETSKEEIKKIVKEEMKKEIPKKDVKKEPGFFSRLFKSGESKTSKKISKKTTKKK